MALLVRRPSDSRREMGVPGGRRRSFCLRRERDRRGPRVDGNQPGNFSISFVVLRVRVLRVFTFDALNER